MNPLPSFSEFFHALWGHDPFPWQIRLADQLANGHWPEWITLPTGTGKTSVIDIAIHTLAQQAGRHPTERTAPVRIVFAVNRRIVVDEAFERARKISEKIRAAVDDPSSPLASVAKALQSLTNDPHAPPLEAFPLRGGTFTDRSWARSPFQPLVLSTTLDQLGSRLLFRGYGVTDYARPIHAALLANDALLILDEAHTATAFSQTLEGISRFRAQAGDELASPFRVVQLTATPPSGAEDPFGLAPDDEAHPIIRRRLSASKPVELASIADAKGKGRHKKLAAAMAEKARAMLENGHRRVLVVVNRVATGEALQATLAPAKGRPAPGARVELLTGRLRPLDRDALVRRLSDTHQLKSAAPDSDVPPLILIATQCIEVGADFDFDALITELAPLDNLRQRFGRLNRYGRDRISPATIFTPEEAVTTPDPKILLAEVKKTRSRDLLVCARANNSEEAEELEMELRKLSSIDGEASDETPESEPSRCLAYITGSELEKMVSSEDISGLLAELNEKWRDPEMICDASRPIGEWKPGGQAVLLCKTSEKFAKPKHSGVKILSKELPAADDQSEDLDDTELVGACQKYAKSVIKGLKKSPITLIPIPEDFDTSLLHDALIEALFPRKLEIHRFEQSTSRSEIQRLCSAAEIERIRKEPLAPRRILVIPRDCHFIATPQAQQNLGNGQDPIYGTALPEVWSWLNTLENLDFGLAAIAPRLPGGDDLAALLAPTAEGPILLAPHLDLLSQTSPEPHISPDPALYIHGPRREFPEVGVVLRDDLDNIADPLELLRLIPPLATEAASVPLHLARQWLAGPDIAADETGDAPMESPSENRKPPQSFEPLPVWRNGEPCILDEPAELRPGDILVIPRDRRKSLDRLMPLPKSEEPADQYESAHLESRDRLAIRFTEAARDQLADALSEVARTRFLEITAPWFAAPNEDEDAPSAAADERQSIPALAALLAEELPDTHPQIALWRFAAWTCRHDKVTRKASDWTIIRYPEGTHHGFLLCNRSRIGATPWPLDPDDIGRQGSRSADAIDLADHSAAVADRAAKNARALPDSLRACIRDAGLLHDIGKLDPRFQALLHGCFLHAVQGRELLAKSGRSRSPKTERQLRDSLHLPKGFRHELLSARIVADASEWLEHPERDLLLHLIASHHGRCRGFAPVVPDSQPEVFEGSIGDFSFVFHGTDAPMAALTDGVPRRFWSLTRRFGWWGLPYLETLLRLADQAESAKPTPS